MARRVGKNGFIIWIISSARCMTDTAWNDTVDLSKFYLHILETAYCKCRNCHYLTLMLWEKA